jgi:hypothetical protein
MIRAVGGYISKTGNPELAAKYLYAHEVHIGSINRLAALATEPSTDPSRVAAAQIEQDDTGEAFERVQADVSAYLKRLSKGGRSEGKA